MKVAPPFKIGPEMTLLVTLLLKQWPIIEASASNLSIIFFQNQ